MKARICVILGSVLLALPSAACLGQSCNRAGWEAQLSGQFHGVAGTVRIVDEDTLEVEHFNYDGGGPAVYFYLASENTDASFTEGIAVGPLLTGTVFADDSLILDLPAGLTLDGFNAISVWCVDRRVNFGSGTFGSVVEYEVTFNATWSAATHQPFPPGPHFSGLIGATHNADVAFWEFGGLASPGIESMAETGSKSPMIDEVDVEVTVGTAYSLISGGGIGRSPGRVTATFKMNSSHPRVSLVSMIAPSPDWFVGIADLKLFRNGAWLGEVVVELWPYDAGTDSGPSFTSANDNTSPPELISQIVGIPFEGAPPLGTFTFRLRCPNPPAGDLNGDCRVDLHDLAILMSNWLVDCNQHPNDSACPTDAVPASRR